MTSTLERIKNFIDLEGISVSAFEKVVGFSNGAFASQLKNRRTIGVDKLENILNSFPQLNPSWSLTGNGDMILDDSSKKSTKNQLSDSESNDLNGEGIVVPVYNVDAYAGDSLSFFGNAQHIEKYYRVPFAKKGDTCLNVVGNSMYPHIHSGDVVVVRQLSNWKEWIIYGKCYAIVTEEQLLIRIIRKSRTSPDTHYNIYSVNSVEYDDFEMPKSDIIQLSLVIGIVGKRAF